MRTILMLLMAVTSAAANADWVAVAGTDARMTYADPMSIRRTGDVAAMRVLTDYKAPQAYKGAQIRSASARGEYDCENRRSRVVSSSLHADPMGAGDAVVTNSAPSDWAPVAQQSTGEVLWKLACRKS
jgi:hypothetical protein